MIWDHHVARYNWSPFDPCKDHIVVKAEITVSMRDGTMTKWIGLKYRYSDGSKKRTWIHLLWMIGSYIMTFSLYIILYTIWQKILKSWNWRESDVIHCIDYSKVFNIIIIICFCELYCIIFLIFRGRSNDFEYIKNDRNL